MSTDQTLPTVTVETVVETVPPVTVSSVTSGIDTSEDEPTVTSKDEPTDEDYLAALGPCGK